MLKDKRKTESGHLLPLPLLNSESSVSDQRFVILRAERSPNKTRRKRKRVTSPLTLREFSAMVLASLCSRLRCIHLKVLKSRRRSWRRVERAATMWKALQWWRGLRWGWMAEPPMWRGKDLYLMSSTGT